MFVVLLTYKKPIDIIDQHLAGHRIFLQAAYEKNIFVASGPKNPRTGGVIISQLKDKKLLENTLKNDPFHIHDLADYEIIEFDPIRYHPNFIPFL
jgi:uncharacterized protein YciI